MSTMAFPLFPNFPVELQLTIWTLTIPDPEPEVCIAWPLTLYNWKNEQPAQPFTVDTGWPTAAHVCRTARAAVLSSGLLRLRHSPTANLAVPFRLFNPTLDTLYWGHNQKSSMRTFLRAPQNQPLALALRHIAVDLPATYPPSDLAELIHQHTTHLHTLSLVLPDTSPAQPAGVHVPFLPPARRCRLADLPPEPEPEAAAARGRRITLTGVPFLPAPYAASGTIPLLAYLAVRRADMEAHVRASSAAVDGLGGVDDDDGDDGRGRGTPGGGGGGGGLFGGLVIKAQTFVEFRLARPPPPTAAAAADEGSGGGRGRWVEVCGRRLLGRDGRAPEARRVSADAAVVARLDPEAYRVLDFDCGWYGMDEFQGGVGVTRGYGVELGLGGRGG